MPRGVGVRVPLSARMFEASDFSSRSSFFCLGQMQALAQQQKNAWSATSRLNMCNKECGLWGCEDRNIFDFQRYPRFTCASLGGRVPLSALQKKLFTRQLFFCAVSATIFTFPPNLPLRKGGYKLGERHFKSFVFFFVRMLL